MADNSTSPEFWDKRYEGDGLIFGQDPNVFLAGAARHIPPGGRVLVPGDGEGRNGAWLAGQGFHVTSVDMSPVGCGKARRLAAARGVPLEIVCADLRDWAWPAGAFDAVASVFLHLPSAIRAGLHARMRDALRPGGVILIEAFEPRHVAFRQREPSVGGPGDADMLFTLDMLKRDFAPLALVSGEETEADLAEGPRHRGRGAVVHAVFRREAGASAAPEKLL